MKAVNISRRITETGKEMKFHGCDDSFVKLSRDITEQMQQSWQAAAVHLKTIRTEVMALRLSSLESFFPKKLSQKLIPLASK